MTECTLREVLARQMDSNGDGRLQRGEYVNFITGLMNLEALDLFSRGTAVPGINSTLHERQVAALAQASLGQDPSHFPNGIESLRPEDTRAIIELGATLRSQVSHHAQEDGRMQRIIYSVAATAQRSKLAGGIAGSWVGCRLGL